MTATPQASPPPYIDVECDNTNGVIVSEAIPWLMDCVAGTAFTDFTKLWRTTVHPGATLATFQPEPWEDAGRCAMMQGPFGVRSVETNKRAGVTVIRVPNDNPNRSTFRLLFAGAKVVGEPPAAIFDIPRFDPVARIDGRLPHFHASSNRMLDSALEVYRVQLDGAQTNEAMVRSLAFALAVAYVSMGRPVVPKSGTPVVRNGRRDELVRHLAALGGASAAAFWEANLTTVLDTIFDLLRDLDKN